MKQKEKVPVKGQRKLCGERRNKACLMIQLRIVNIHNQPYSVHPDETLLNAEYYMSVEMGILHMYPLKWISKHMWNKKNKVEK